MTHGTAGREIIAERQCVQCKQSFPMTSDYFKVRTCPTSTHGVRWNVRCRKCYQQRERERMAQRVYADDSERPFDKLQREMEVTHGPQRTWSRDTHREFSNALYAHLGWQQRAEQDLTPHTLPLDYSSPLIARQLDAVARGAMSSP